jgi:hypothetical protein
VLPFSAAKGAILGVPVPLSSNAAAASRAAPRSKRIQLDTMDRVRRELARIYVAARDGELDTQDFSRLANGLSILGRLVEGGNLEKRVEALEGARG